MREQFEQIAAKLDLSQEPHSVICDAVWAVHGEQTDLHDRYDSVWGVNDTIMFFYLVVEEGPTIIAYETNDGTQVAVAELGAHLAELTRQYCSKHDGQICQHCQRPCHKDCVECPDCGWYTNGTQCPPLTLPEDLATMLEDGGSDRYLWVCTRRLETHQTVANHSYVFIQLHLLPEEGRYRGEFEKPERWWGAVSIVNVGSAGKAGSKAACSYQGIENWKELSHQAKAQALLETGICATAWQEDGTSTRKLLDAAVTELGKVYMLAGFYLDRSQNAIGSTGWDFLKGNVLAGMQRRSRRL